MAMDRDFLDDITSTVLLAPDSDESSDSTLPPPSPVIKG